MRCRMRAAFSLTCSGDNPATICRNSATIAGACSSNGALARGRLQPITRPSRSTRQLPSPYTRSANVHGAGEGSVINCGDSTPGFSYGQAQTTSARSSSACCNNLLFARFIVILAVALLSSMAVSLLRRDPVLPENLSGADMPEPPLIRITQLIVRNGDVGRLVLQPRLPYPSLADARFADSARPSIARGAFASRGSNRDIAPRLA